MLWYCRCDFTRGGQVISCSLRRRSFRKARMPPLAAVLSVTGRFVSQPSPECAFHSSRKCSCAQLPPARAMPWSPNTIPATIGTVLLAFVLGFKARMTCLGIDTGLVARLQVISALALHFVFTLTEYSFVYYLAPS